MYEKVEQLKDVLNLDKEAIASNLIEEKQRLEEEARLEHQRQKRLFYILSSIFISLIIFALVVFTLFKDSNPFKSDIAQNEKNDIKQAKILKIEEPKKEQLKQELEKTAKVETAEVKEEATKEITQNIEPVKVVEQKPKEIIKEVIVEKEIIVEKEVVVEKIVPMSREKMQEALNGKKYNIAKCYDYTNTTLKPTNTCKEKLSKFFVKNKDAIRFEVIGVIGEDDIKRADTLTQDKTIKDYIIRGVARDRVIEASWLIKEVHKSKALVSAVNFYITSKKNNKGIVVRAYH